MGDYAIVIGEVMIAIVTGVLSSACTVAILRTDMKWIKETLKTYDERLTFVERKARC